MVGLGFFEFLILILPFFFGSGLPLGMPPGPDDPVLQALISDEQVGFAYWPGRAPVDASANRTEAFMARPELFAFAMRCREALRRSLAVAVSEDDPPTAPFLTEVIDELAWGPLFRPTLVVLNEFDLAGFRGDFGPTPKIGVVLVNQLGERSRDITAAFTKWVAAQREINKDFVRSEQGVDLIQLFVPGEQNVLYVTVREGYVMIGSDVQWMVTAQLTPQPSQGVNACLAKIQETLPVPRRCSVAQLRLDKFGSLNFFDDANHPTDMFERFVGKQLKAVTRATFVTGLDDHGFLSRASIELPDGAPFLDVLPAAPLSPELLAPIPEETTAAIALRLDPKMFLTVLAQQISEATGEGQAFRSMLDSVDQLFGVKLEDDLLEVMEDFAFFYSKFNVVDPSKGWVLGIRLRDEMSFQDMLHRINARVADYLQNNDMRFSETVNNQVTIYSVGTDQFGVVPGFSYALVEKYLVFSLDPATIGNFIRNLRQEKNFASKPSTERLFAESEKMGLSRPLALMELDTAGVLRILLPLLTQFLGEQSMFPEVADPQWDVKFKDIPSVDVLTKDVEPSLVAVYKSEKGFQLLIRQTYPGTSPLAFAGGVFPLAVPFVVKEVNRMATSLSSNNMKQQLLAVHNFHDTYNRLPASSSVSAEGKPLLSWRVHLLPYLDQLELYNEFHLDEPWDSEHNSKLVARMPAVFRHPKAKVAEGHTVYLGVYGKNGFFGPQAKGSPAKQAGSMAQILDGLSMTVAIVEAAEAHAVPWTQPSDLDFETIEGDLLPYLGRYWGSKNQINVGLGDGSVRKLVPDITEKGLREILTIRGGEVISEETIFEIR